MNQETETPKKQEASDNSVLRRNTLISKGLYGRRMGKMHNEELQTYTFQKI
jgi:hypothetical protein